MCKNPTCAQIAVLQELCTDSALTFYSREKYRKSRHKENPNKNKITSIISFPSLFESFLLSPQRHRKSLQREGRAHRRQNHERGVHGFEAEVVGQRAGGSSEGLRLVIKYQRQILVMK